MTNKIRDLDRVDFGKWTSDKIHNKGRAKILDTEFEVDVEKLEKYIADGQRREEKSLWTAQTIASHITEIIRGKDEVL